jgi:hypothetical protein
MILKPKYKNLASTSIEGFIIGVFAFILPPLTCHTHLQSTLKSSCFYKLTSVRVDLLIGEYGGIV